jgi:hypothetical protein
VCGILYMVSQLAHMKEGLLALTIVSAGYTDDDDDQDEEHYEDIKLEVCDALFSRCFSNCIIVFSMDMKVKTPEVGNEQLSSHRYADCMFTSDYIFYLIHFTCKI